MEDSFGKALDRGTAQQIVTAELKALLAVGDPPSRLLEPYKISALILANPGIGKYLPKDKETLMSNYVVPIDRAAVHEMTGFIHRLPGLINISMDGATINSKQKVSDFSSLHLFSVENTH